jgi:hypothetical protein
VNNNFELSQIDKRVKHAYAEGRRAVRLSPFGDADFGRDASSSMLFDDPRISLADGCVRYIKFDSEQKAKVFP